MFSEVGMVFEGESNSIFLPQVEYTTRLLA